MLNRSGGRLPRLQSYRTAPPMTFSASAFKISRTYLGWRTPPAPGLTALGLIALAALGLVGFLFGFVFQIGFVSPYDKVVHAGFFLALAGALLLLLPGRMLAVAAVAVTLGAASELGQSLTPFRFASFNDFFADLVGIAAFLAIGAALRTAHGFQPQAS